MRMILDTTSGIRLLNFNELLARHHGMWPLGIALVGTFTILLIRGWGQLAFPEFWAEDAVLFWQDARRPGFDWHVPYERYLHIIPRAIADAAQLFPTHWHPDFFVYTATFFTMWTVYIVASSKIYAAPFIAVVIALMPTNEVYFNVTNIQWVTAIGLIILAAAPSPNTIAGHFHRLGFAVLAGLSGPFAIFVAPSAVMSLFRERSIYRFVLAATLSSCAVIQLSFILTSGSFDAAGEPNATALTFSLFQATFVRIVEGQYGGGVLISLVAMCIWLASFASRERRLERCLIVLPAALIMLAVAQKFWNMPTIFNSIGQGDRYFFIPIWAILATTVMLWGARYKLIVGGALIWFAAAYNEDYWVKDAYPVQEWNNYAPRIDAGESVSVPINPEGWTIRVNTEDT